GQGARDPLSSTIRPAAGRVDLLGLYGRGRPPGLADALAGLAEDCRGRVILGGQALQHWRQAAGAAWEQQRHWRCWVPGARVAALAAELGCTDVVICDGADDDSVLAAIGAHPITP